MTIIIIDDEQPSREALKIKLKQVAPMAQIIAEYPSAVEAYNQLDKLDAELVFLDVEMPHMDGISFLEKLHERNFEVIITTAHAEYAIKAVRQSALDFLLKPVDIQDLNAALARFLAKKEAKKISNTDNHSRSIRQFDKIPVPSLRGLSFIPMAEIEYLSSDGGYTNIYLKGQKNILSSKSLGEYESLLEHFDFLRIHHGTIINLHFIKEYLKGEGGSIIMESGAELDVSKRRKKELLQAIGF